MHSYIHVFIYSCNIEEESCETVREVHGLTMFSTPRDFEKSKCRRHHPLPFPGTISSPPPVVPTIFTKATIFVLFCWLVQVMERMSLMGLLGVLSKYIADEPLAEQLEQAIHRLRPGEARGP